MRRFLIAITGGILIPLFLFGFTMMTAESLEHGWGLGWLANLLMFSFVGPMVIWERVFPSCPPVGLLIRRLLQPSLQYSCFTP